MNRRDFLKTTLTISGATLLPITLPEQAEAVVPKEKFSTGLPRLDKMIGGGIRPGELCLVMGSTRSGKTAFCNSVARANKMNLNRRTIGNLYLKGVEFDNEGANDLLVLNPKNHCAFFSNYITPLIEPEHEWDRLSNTVRALRNHAFTANEAVIWTIPINRISESSSYFSSREYSLSSIRSADCCIMCDRERRLVSLMKNRHCDKGTVAVKFECRDNQIVMCESDIG